MYSKHLLTLSLILGLPFLASCSKEAEPTAMEMPMAAPSSDAPMLHGVVQEVRADQGTIVVKHDAIPGVMMAMTMPYKVDAATLKTAQKDQEINARMVQRDGSYWLEEVKPVMK